MMETENILDLEIANLSDIPGSETWIRVSRILEGDSSDRKFYVKNKDRQRFFLRIADTSQYDRKKNEYEFLHVMKDLGADVPDPVGFGLCNHGRSLYLQTRWLYGYAGPAELQKLDVYKQYALGVDAGLYLKMAHSCPIPPRPDVWEARQQERCRQLLEQYRHCRCKIAYEQKLLDLIQNNLPLLAGRPQTLLHGGFHTDNIVLSYEYSLSLIDFDNWQFGDPLHDLANVLTRIRHISLPYAIGILDCYFVLRINEEELRLLALYGALDLLGQVTAAARSGSEACVRAELERAQIFIRDLQGCKNICPTWYKRIRISDKAARRNREMDLAESG